MSLLPILEQSDLVAAVPRDIAEICCRYAAMRIVEMPRKPPVIVVCQFWHQRVHKDPAHAWFRGVIQALCEALRSRAEA